MNFFKSRKTQQDTAAVVYFDKETAAEQNVTVNSLYDVPAQNIVSSPNQNTVVKIGDKFTAIAQLAGDKLVIVSDKFLPAMQKMLKDAVANVLAQQGLSANVEAVYRELARNDQKVRQQQVGHFFVAPEFPAAQAAALMKKTVAELAVASTKSAQSQRDASRVSQSSKETLLGKFGINRSAEDQAPSNKPSFTR